MYFNAVMACAPGMAFMRMPHWSLASYPHALRATYPHALRAQAHVAVSH